MPGSPLAATLVVALVAISALIGYRIGRRTKSDVPREIVVAALSEAVAGVLVIGDDDRVTWTGGAMPVFPTSVLGHPYTKVFAGWPGVAARIRHAFNGVASREVVVVAGQHIAVTCVPDVTEDNHRKVGVAIVDMSLSDVVARRLEEASRSKDRLIASVSHELRTPLTAIVGFSETSLEAARSGEPGELEDHLRVILVEARDMADIIEDLLVVSRVEAGGMTVTSQLVDLPAETARVLDLLDGRLDRHVGVGGRRVVAIADPLRFRQVVRNLLTNALRHGGEKIEVVTGSDLGGVWVEVRDSGPEIPAETQARMFEAFEGTQLPGVTGSIGLGLHLSRTLAERMGGSLTYHHDGEWSIFRLRLRGAAPKERRPTGGESPGSEDPDTVPALSVAPRR